MMARESQKPCCPQRASVWKCNSVLGHRTTLKGAQLGRTIWREKREKGTGRSRGEHELLLVFWMLLLEKEAKY